MIASVNPMLILYRPGYFRLTYEDFDMDINPFDLEAKVKHLTNTSL